jgi:pimeloyl-ACP methyl ester carboxylesterase
MSVSAGIDAGSRFPEGATALPQQQRRATSNSGTSSRHEKFAKNDERNDSSHRPAAGSRGRGEISSHGTAELHDGDDAGSQSTAALFVSAQKCATERLSRWAANASDTTTSSPAVGSGKHSSRRAFTRSPTHTNWDELIFAGAYNSSPASAAVGLFSPPPSLSPMSSALPARLKLRKATSDSISTLQGDHDSGDDQQCSHKKGPPASIAENPATVAASGSPLPASLPSHEAALPWSVMDQPPSRGAPLRSARLPATTTATTAKTAFDSIQQRVALQYRCANSADFLNEIYTPTLLVHSQDDPIVPFEKLPRDSFSRNPHLFLCVSPRGGHACFVESLAQMIGALPKAVFSEEEGGPGRVDGASWLEGLICEFCAAVAEHR